MKGTVRPRIRAIVSFPLDPHPALWSEPALVSLQTAAELQARGWVVLVDPQDVEEFATWERSQRVPAPVTPWLDQP